MNHAEFMGLHANCVTTLRAYFVSAENTSTMLAEMHRGTNELHRSLMSQEMAENNAHLTYLVAKSILFSAARLGYGHLN